MEPLDSFLYGALLLFKFSGDETGPKPPCLGLCFVNPPAFHKGDRLGCGNSPTTAPSHFRARGEEALELGYC